MFKFNFINTFKISKEKEAQLSLDNLIHSTNESSRRKFRTSIRVGQTTKKTAPADLVFDQIAFVLMIGALIFMTFAIVNFTQSDDPEFQALGQNALIVTVLALTGLVMMLFFATVGSEEERLSISVEGFDRQSLVRITEAFAIASIGVGITNFILFGSVATPKYSVTGFDLFLFTVLIAIVEELFFTFLIQVTFRFLFKSNIVGIVARGIAFSVWHFAVYSSDWRLMLSTFLGGIFLAIALERSDRITSNILSHVAINFLASLPLLIGTFQTA